MTQIALNFHGLGDPHAGVAADERPYWLSFARFRQIMGRVIELGRKERTIITFDDGNKSDLAGAEIAAEHGLRGYVFALAGRLDAAHYLTPADLRHCAQMGMVMGLHGMDHVDWRRLDDAALGRETIKARAMLSDALGQRVDEVAIPFGAYDRRVLGWLKRQRFSHIHTSDRGSFAPAAKIWNRNTLRADTSDAEIEAILTGTFPLKQRVRGTLSQFVRRNLR